MIFQPCESIAWLCWMGNGEISEPNCRSESGQVRPLQNRGRQSGPQAGGFRDGCEGDFCHACECNNKSVVRQASAIRKYRTGVLQHRGEAAILSAITSTFDMGAKGA